MPRRRARSKPEQDIAAVVAAVVAMLVFINWGMPSLWASIKFILFLGIGGVVVIGGIALLVQASNSSDSKVSSFDQRMPRTQRKNNAWRPPTSSSSPQTYTRPIQQQPSSITHTYSRPAQLQPSSPPKPSPQPGRLDAESLRRMDWLGFERLVVDLFQHLGFSARKTSAGADGGVDIELRSKSTPLTSPPQALIQCKARSKARIGVDKVRELLGVVTATGAGRGVLVTNSEFSDEARAFAKPVSILQIGDIQWLLKTINKLPDHTKNGLEAKHFALGYDIPSCVVCELKLKPRNGPKGPFWGCSNFSNPAVKCRTTMMVRRFDEVHFLQS